MCLEVPRCGPKPDTLTYNAENREIAKCDTAEFCRGQKTHRKQAAVALARKLLGHAAQWHGLERQAGCR